MNQGTREEANQAEQLHIDTTMTDPPFVTDLLPPIEDPHHPELDRHTPESMEIDLDPEDAVPVLDSVVYVFEDTNQPPVMTQK